MIALFEILLVAFNIWMAHYHSKLIERGITPKHGWWGLAYICATAFCTIILDDWVFENKVQVFSFVMAALLIRKVFFDTALNLFRNKPLFYVSSTTTSIIDKIHYKLFGNRSELYIIFYFLAIIIFNILLCLLKNR